MTAEPIIHPAVPEDAEAIAAIWNQGIEEREATFETAAPDPGTIATSIKAGALLLAAEIDGRTAGFAKIARYDDPSAYYAGIGEVSLYVDRKYRRSGIGKALLEALANEAADRGLNKLIGKIFTSNEASVALFRSCGFRDVGIHHRHGRLGGEWRDVLLVERLL